MPNKLPTHNPNPQYHKPTTMDKGYDATWNKLSRMIRRQHPICQRCNENLSDLVHHIVPLNNGGERLDERNLMAVCVECHAEIHQSMGGGYFWWR